MNRSRKADLQEKGLKYVQLLVFACIKVILYANRDRIMDRSGKFAGENPFEIARDWMDQAKLRGILAVRLKGELLALM